ncbi:hypothetical protein ACS0TY_009348 [Phlomoides rotata]
MANDNSKPTQTLFPLETCPQVSDDDFNLFHSIDRDLYTRLLQTLGRDPTESVRIMAFWMWLERESNDGKLVKRLLSLPPLLLNEVADETKVCLMCLESDKLHFGGEISLLPEILNCPIVSLRFFHENRSAVLRSIAKLISTVCARAFRDIPERVRRGNTAVEVPAVIPAMMFNPHVTLHHPALALQMPHSPPVAARLPLHIGGGFPALDLAAQRHLMTNNDLGEMVNRNVSREENLPIDDRTVFLTFSKGYPTTEDEVKDYFTRRFGDFIEELILQDVGEDEQVLYARMIVNATAVGVIEEIVGRGNKAKYTINGKHVWARKYVKKSRSPPRGGRSGAANSP